MKPHHWQAPKQIQCCMIQIPLIIEGSTDIAFREDVGKRFEAQGWQVLRVQDGNDIDAIDNAIAQASRD